MEIDVAGIVETALQRGASEDDLEARIDEVCRERYPQGWEQARRSCLRMVEDAAENLGGGRLAAARTLADGNATASVQSFTGSLEDMPPDVRERFEQMMREGRTSGTVERVVRRQVTPAEMAALHARGSFPPPGGSPPRETAPGETGVTIHTEKSGCGMGVVLLAAALVGAALGMWA